MQKFGVKPQDGHIIWHSVANACYVLEMHLIYLLHKSLFYSKHNARFDQV